MVPALHHLRTSDLVHGSVVALFPELGLGFDLGKAHAVFAQNCINVRYVLACFFKVVNDKKEDQANQAVGDKSNDLTIGYSVCCHN